MKTVQHNVICICGNESLDSVFLFKKPPVHERTFTLAEGCQYLREIVRCNRCRHFLSIHDFDTSSLYLEDYVNANYCDEGGIRETFERINSLDPSKSDNCGRVAKVLEFSVAHFAQSGFRDYPMEILDVGSGLCVFLHKMKTAGWNCTAVDPDIRNINHAREVVGVKGIHGNFNDIIYNNRFDVVTFNKVLEHIENPVRFLTKARECIKPGGFLYVEVPDGEVAVSYGYDREEFTIDHVHVYSAASLAINIEKSGFQLICMERTREPSGKFTLRAFFKLK